MNTVKTTATMALGDNMVSVSLPMSVLRSMLSPEQTAKLLMRRRTRRTVVAAHRARRPGLYALAPAAQKKESVRACSNSAKQVFAYLRDHKTGATRHELRDQLALTPGSVTGALRTLQLKRVIVHHAPEPIAA